MKKTFALIVALMLCFSIAACGTTEATEPVVTTAPAIGMTDLEKYVEENKAQLLSSMEESFASSGMTCTSDIEVIDSGLVMTINVNELDNVDQATKDQLQATYNSLDATFEDLLAKLRKEIDSKEM